MTPKNLQYNQLIAPLRAVTLVLLIGGATLCLQLPGCIQERLEMGGPTTKEMDEGSPTPVTFRFLEDGHLTPVRVYFKRRGRPYNIGPAVGWYFPVILDRYYQDRFFRINPDVPILDLVFQDYTHGGNDHHYYFLTGEATVTLVPGSYEITAYKGMEHKPCYGTLKVGAEPM